MILILRQVFFSLNESISENRVKFYPNPTSHEISVQIKNLYNFDLKTFDINGKLIEKMNKT